MSSPDAALEPAPSVAHLPAAVVALIGGCVLLVLRPPLLRATSAPVCANIKAVLIAVVVLPSEGWLEVTRIVFGGWPAEDNNREVRKWR